MALRPVAEIGITGDAISFRRGASTHVVPWVDVRAAEVVHGYRKVARSGIEYDTRTVRLDTPAGRLAFDVSERFPEFEDPGELLADVVRGVRVPIGEHARIPVWRTRWFALVALLLVASVPLLSLHPAASLASLGAGLLLSTRSVGREVVPERSVLDRTPHEHSP